MEGPTIATAADQGMIPRTLTKIYQESNRLKEKGWEYEIEAEFIEIYNDTLQDLLNLGTKKTLEIKKDPAGNTYITNTKRVAVKSEAAIRRVLEMARGNRTTASTNANERSSRSHSVFMLHLHGTHTVTGEEIHGVLNLIDLAGSERVALSGAKGDRLKEAQAINKSLSALGDVIEALNKPNGAHVPYRNSKLTYLLHSSLGGDSKVLMFVNINPASASCAETLSSLRFAAKVNTTQLNNK
jgi:kinesin family protein C1